ncbi:hypothetical protein [Streptomyces sp. PTY087I2]|uniref:hypothetical protein n=1 Tax=Streptomyces sp. PTY087I2 TaxID=1819298 RepID=UPI000828EF51|nr:hypothetical protein [Streptomyces sp. PTY087I2]OCC11546.1 hypothetical protein A3Q37_02743 [Streptomyces sp. PTY087I2]
MTNSPDSAENEATRPTADLQWRRHLPTLASAAAGIHQASDDWDAVSDSFCDQDGWPIDEKGYADGKVKRDAEAWKHAEVFLDLGPEVLAGVREAASGDDYVEGAISDDLRWLRGIDTTLEHARQLRREWDEVVALIDGPLPGTREIYEERAQEHRNSEGWHYAHELGIQGPALIRAAEHLAHRADTEQAAQTERARVALARSSSGTREAPRTDPPVPRAPNPAPPGRSR